MVITFRECTGVGEDSRARWISQVTLPSRESSLTTKSRQPSPQTAVASLRRERQTKVSDPCIRLNESKNVVASIME
jgi:hypothetical protein